VPRLMTIPLLLMTLVSFNTYQPVQGWDISREDSTLWVRYCEDTNVSALQQASLNSSVLAVLDEYNNVSSSYVTLSRYPEDTDQPPAPPEGFSSFSAEKAEFRTITICFNFGNDPTASGQAILEFNGSDWAGCEIQLADSHLTTPDYFQATLLHEMGHCLGLGHPQDTEQAIMSYNSRGYSQLSLGIDDKMGLTYLYPQNPEDGNETLTFGIGCRLNP